METETAMILLYHGVSAVRSKGIENFSGKHIAADVFEQQMKLLATRARPVSLRDLAREVASGQPIQPGTVAVTFDDSFLNVREVALPILQRHGVPATFFVSTGFVGSNRRFWVDRLEHAIGTTARPSLDVDLRGAGVHHYPLTTDAERIKAVVEIKRTMKGLPPPGRDALLSEIEAAAGPLKAPNDVPNYATLTWDDVRALDAPPHYEVGGHTVNHEILAYLSDDALEFEIGECLRTLTSQLGRRIDLFSYPEGQAAHFNDRVIGKLRSHGVTVCPTAITGLNPRGVDAFHLRRLMVGFMGEPFPNEWFAPLQGATS